MSLAPHEKVSNDMADKSSFLHNAIYRYVVDCVDGELSGIADEIAVDYLLELGDHSLLNDLQSSFLSVMDCLISLYLSVSMLLRIHIVCLQVMRSVC